MLTYVLIILTSFSAEMGGGGPMQAEIKFPSENYCKSIRRMIKQALSDKDGWISDCTPLVVPEVLLVEPKP